MPLPEIWTSRYQNQDAIIGSGLVPVRITVGGVRFKLRYDLRYSVPELAPFYWTLKLDQGAFTMHYLEKVDRNRQTIEWMIDKISAENDRKGLVLLCFEDLTKPGQWCHRQILAKRLEQWSGQPILELPIP